MNDKTLIERALIGTGWADRVAAVWIFGSRVKGRATRSSDLDVAILTEGKVSSDALLDLRSRLARELEVEVDLVDLRSASPILCMQVIREGRLALDNIPYVRAMFVCSVPSRYYDLVRVRQAAERQLLKRISDGRA